MISARTTRLVAVPSLAALRRALLERAAHDSVSAARAHAILVPTHGAAEHLRRAIESDCLPGAGAVVLPHMFTRDEWLAWLFQHLPSASRLLSPCEREVLLGAAARRAIADGASPPFSVRPALVAELLAFYDTFRRQLKTVEDFERLAITKFARDADEDLGAARLLQQARFMVASYRSYEQRLFETSRSDEHVLRAALLAEPDLPLRQVTVTVGDRAGDPGGLWAADFDLLARLSGVTAIDILATDATLAAGFRQRLREHLPGIDEVVWSDPTGRAASLPPILVTPHPQADRLFHQHRDREDELAWAIRHIKHDSRSTPAPALSRVAIVFKRPLPYVYLAGQLFPAAGVPHETFEALPLASEPAAAALDLVVECVSSSFSREAVVSLLRSPHFRFEIDGHAVLPYAAALLDRELSEARYLAEPDMLVRLAAEWAATPDTQDHRSRSASFVRAARAAAGLTNELAALVTAAPPSVHLGALLAFLAVHDRTPAADDDVRQRHLRARAAVLASVVSLRDAHRAFDDSPRSFDETAAALHRWIERHTFAPHRGGGGVLLADAQAARFGEFDTVYLVGLTQREWPETARASIFFPGATLKELGWPDDADARAAERAGFTDLLRLAGGRVFVSTFTLEDDAIVEPSPFLEDLAETPLERRADEAPSRLNVFVDDALAAEPLRADAVRGQAAEWLTIRQSRTDTSDPRYHGQVFPTAFASYKVSSLDRYLDCPFVYFAEQVLRIKEEPEDEEGLSPRTQGRVLHEVLQTFFDAWQRDGYGAITADNLDGARRLFAEVVEARLSTLPEGDAAIERTRFLGSPAGPGIADIVLGVEAERPAAVVERLLEYPLSGEAEFRAQDGSVRRIAVRATADRLDLLEDGTFRVFDYKRSKPPDIKSAVQLPAYAAAARARLDGRRGRTWRPSDAAYIAFGKAPYYKPLAADPEDLDAALASGEARLAGVIDRIERGQFPPQPRIVYRCSYCPYSSVCRKDFVRAED